MPSRSSRALSRSTQSAAEYRLRLIEIAIMTDPWSVGPSMLLPLESRLSRAQQLLDQLAGERPENLDYLQSQIHVHAKLGAVMQRLGRPRDAETGYRRAIDLAGSLIERSPSPARATIDRADVREALARLVLEGGDREQARTLLEGAVADLHSLDGTRRLSPLLAERFESLAQGFEALGESERAEVVAGWAHPARVRPPSKQSGAFDESKIARRTKKKRP